MTQPPKRSRDLVNKVFGEAFPAVSGDEREPDSPDTDADHDRWLRDNVPPHHD